MKLDPARRRSRWTAICCLWLWCAAAAQAQRHHFTVYSVEHGLAQSQVYSLLQDRQGYLWAGTAGGGASRFDGQLFTTFDKAGGLAGNVVRDVILDRQGNVWLATEGGASRFDGESFRHFDSADGLASDVVYTIFQDRQGYLWFGTTAGVSRFDGTSFTTFNHQDGAPGGTVRALLEDRQGVLWLGTETGVSRFDGERFRSLDALDGHRVYALLEDSSGDLWLGTGRGAFRWDGASLDRLPQIDAATGGLGVKSLLQDRAGKIWLGTDGAGVLIYDGSSVDRLTVAEGLASDSVWSILEDREGNIWLGTYRGGICKYGGGRFVHYGKSEGLGGEVIRSIVEDRQGDLWFGTYRAGVSRYDGGSFTRLTTADGLAHDFVLTIMEDRDGEMWFGTFRGVSRYDGASFTNYTMEDGLAGNLVRAILEDTRGKIWIGTNAGDLSVYDGSGFETRTTGDGLAINSVMTIVEGHAGNVWIGTLGGLHRFDGRRLADVTGALGLGPIDVYSILEGEGGELWLGAYGKGLIRYSPSRASGTGEAEGSVEIFDSDGGLPDDRILLLSFDATGKLWLGTEKGAYRFDVEDYRRTGERTFRFYGAEEGFTGIECLHNAVAQDSEGGLWFGTVRGATRYDPMADKRNSVEPLTQVTGVRLFLEPVDLSPYATGVLGDAALPQRLSLPHRLNHVTFDFIGVSLTSPEKVGYRFRLAGFDDDWSPVTRDRHATYSNLPPGRYAFSVEAGNGDGVWNRSPATLELTIKSPYWQTWWFRGLVLAAVLGTAATLHGARIRRAKAVAIELERQVAERTAEIVQENEEIEDMNAALERFVYTVSHDLKSPLITIRGFLGMLEKDAEAGDRERMRQDITRIRNASGRMAILLDELLELSRIGRTTNPPEDVAMSELAGDAVEQVAGEIAERGAEVVIAPDLPAVRGDRQRLLEVLQNLIANAVRYMGDQPRPRVEVGARRSSGETVIFVRDNGIGIDPRYHQKIFALFERLQPDTEGTGIGLALVKRIVEVHGGRVWVESEGDGRGATFCFTLPGGEVHEPLSS